MNCFKRSVIIIAVIILLVSIFPVSALAETIDEARLCSLTIISKYNGTPIPGMTYSLYRVGDATGSAPQLTLTGSYASFPIDPNNMDTASWDSFALTLQSYVRSNGLSADASCTSLDDGTAIASSLPCGLYLVTSSRTTINEKIYEASPFMIVVPGSSNNGLWNYSPQALPKLTKRDVGRITVSVLKIWDDWWYQGDRPNSVCIHLLCDGVEYDSVILNERCSWRYAWSGLNAEKEWTLYEDYVEDYLVTIRQSGSKYMITNRYNGNHLPPPEPPQRRLPQTGLVWWPIYLLAGVGALFFFFGLTGLTVRRKTTVPEQVDTIRSRYDENE